MKDKGKKNSVQYNKKRIEDFSKYNEDEAAEFLKSIKYGTVVMAYPQSLEKDIYKYVAALIYKKYPQYSKEDEILKILSSYGHIYTAKIQNGLGSGLYHINSASVLIYSFLNKLNEGVVHELVHKLGYLQFNEDFYEMPKIYAEAGTDLITNTVLEKPICRELILGRMWTRSVGVQPRYLVETLLVNQLSKALGNDSLERSILDGKNYIEQDLKNMMGEDKYVLLFTKLTDICRLEKKYWASKKSKSKEIDIYNKMTDFQEDILQEIFEKRFANIKNEQEANNLLSELMKFSDYRIKLSSPKEKDERFSKYFDEKKKSLEKKFNTVFEIEDITDSWEERYPVVRLDQKQEDKENEEKAKIDSMAEEKKQKNRGFFRKLITSKNSKKNIIGNSQIKYLDESNLNYIKQTQNGIIITNTKENNEKKDVENPEK